MGTDAHAERQKWDRAAHRATESLYDRIWPARIAQIVLGVWLLVTTWLWPHHYLQGMVALVGGGLAVVFSLVAVKVPPVRALLGLLPVWVLIGTLFQPANPATLANNILWSLAIFVLSFLPRGHIQLFRAERRQITP